MIKINSRKLIIIIISSHHVDNLKQWMSKGFASQKMVPAPGAGHARFRVILEALDTNEVIAIKLDEIVRWVFATKTWGRLTHLIWLSGWKSVQWSSTKSLDEDAGEAILSCRLHFVVNFMLANIVPKIVQSFPLPSQLSAPVASLTFKICGPACGFSLILSKLL